MTDVGTDELLELAARCEKATVADRYLDREIAQTVVGDVHPEWNIFNAPRFTASLDAAMTLVPEGNGWQADSNGTAKVSVEGPPYSLFYADAASPALALCAAALRARSRAATREDER